MLGEQHVLMGEFRRRQGSLLDLGIAKVDILVAKQRGGYQKPTIQDEHLSMIKSWVEGKNDLLLTELCDAPLGLARSGSPCGKYRN